MGKNQSKESLGQITEKHIDELWRKMTKMYGATFTNQYGEIDDGTWLRALKNLTPQELGIGLDKCLDRDSEFPPGLGVFRRLCRPKQYSYHQIYRALPSPPPDIEMGSAALTEIRNILKRGDVYEKGKKEAIEPGSDPATDDVGQVVDDSTTAGDAEAQAPPASDGDHSLGQDPGSQEE